MLQWERGDPSRNGGFTSRGQSCNSSTFFHLSTTDPQPSHLSLLRVLSQVKKKPQHCALHFRILSTEDNQPSHLSLLRVLSQVKSLSTAPPLLFLSTEDNQPSHRPLQILSQGLHFFTFYSRSSARTLYFFNFYSRSSPRALHCFTFYSRSSSGPSTSSLSTAEPQPEPSTSSLSTADPQPGPSTSSNFYRRFSATISLYAKFVVKWEVSTMPPRLFTFLQRCYWSKSATDFLLKEKKHEIVNMLEVTVKWVKKCHNLWSWIIGRVTNYTRIECTVSVSWQWNCVKFTLETAEMIVFSVGRAAPGFSSWWAGSARTRSAAKIRYI